MANLISDMIDKSQTQQQSNNGLPTSLEDPRMQKTKEYVQNHGGNPKAAFYQLCKEKMLNPLEVINRLMGGQM